MIGAIAGDIIGSVHEFGRTKSKEFPLFAPDSTFTDDSVLTVAVARAILTDGDYQKAVREIGRRYPNAGYGGFFAGWLRSSDPKPYNSWGNGSAMRVSPVGFAFDSVDDVLSEAARTAEFTHNHPEGVKGAQAAALAVFLARTERDKDLIRTEIASRFGYDLVRTVDGIHLIRRRRPERDLPRRRRRHARLYHGRHRRGLLRPAPRQDQGKSPGHSAARTLEGHGRFRQPFRSNRVDSWRQHRAAQSQRGRQGGILRRHDGPHPGAALREPPQARLRRLRRALSPGA
jgi:hypothetical protein